jgi:L-amino acid N-acyltransferase YncA
MDELPSALLDVSLRQVRECWAERLEVDLRSLENSGFTLIPREGSYGITALQFIDSIVAICQPALLPTLSSLSPVDFLDMPLLLKRLNGYKVNPIGIASISYADLKTLKESSSLGITREGNVQDVESILSVSAESEQEESGVARMPAIFVAESLTGKPAAIASYEIWNNKIAQIGVLTKPEYRSQGFASLAARAASHSALSLGLIPQWRCRVGNLNSERLSQKLGFHNVGLQLAIDVLPS